MYLTFWLVIEDILSDKQKSTDVYLDNICYKMSDFYFVISVNSHSYYTPWASPLNGHLCGIPSFLFGTTVWWYFAIKQQSTTLQCPKSAALSKQPWEHSKHRLFCRKVMLSCLIVAFTKSHYSKTSPSWVKSGGRPGWIKKKSEL